jgi:hypothetical protein
MTFKFIVIDFVNPSFMLECVCKFIHGKMCYVVGMNAISLCHM